MMYFLTLFLVILIRNQKEDYENMKTGKNRLFLAKKWPNQGDNMRIIVIQLSEKLFFVLYQDYFSSQFHPGLSDIRKKL